jgi:hypothetical protein
MKISLYVFALCISAFGISTAYAALLPSTGAAPVRFPGESSSSAALPDAPEPRFASAAVPEARPSGGMRAFSAVGIDVKVGVSGIGFDVATPMGNRINLRAGATFFSYNLNNLVEDGFNINGNIRLRSVNTSVDIYPFGSGFRISPGVTLYNGDNFSGNATVPGGNTITLNDTDYTSSPTDPLIATFTTPNNRFGNRVAPSITTGFGNLIPRHGGHWSVPFEIGMQYISPPKIVLGLTGTACSTDGCSNVQTDPTTQANVKAQQDIINGDIYNLRFFPILSIGLGYKF